jgi:glycosyltransferase involved in cell wall biosynthesis
MNRQISNILILNQYYPPDTSATASIAETITKALCKKYSVKVIAGRPSCNPDAFHAWYLFRRIVHGKLVIEHVGSTALSRHLMAGRLINYFSYLLLMIPRVVLANADVILSMTDPPIVGFVGALVAHVRKRPFVYYIQDLHPDMAFASGLVKKGHLLYFWRSLHRWILKRADLIIVLGEDMRKRVVSQGTDPEKIEVVRHGAPMTQTFASYDHPVIQEINGRFSFTVVHAGNLGFYGAWDALIKAAILLEGEDVGFVFVGEGAAKPMVRRLASSCEMVRFLPFRPPDEVPYVLAAGDIHVVTIRQGIEGMVVPSKLYPLLAAGRPVLAVVPKESDIAHIVTQSRCGIVADPDDPSSIASEIRGLMDNRERLKEMSMNARALSPEYESNKQLRRFVGLIEKAAVSDFR